MKKIISAIIICTLTICINLIPVYANDDYFDTEGTYPAWLNAIDNHDFTYTYTWREKSGTKYLKFTITGGGQTHDTKETYWYALSSSYKVGYIGKYYVSRYMVTNRENTRHYYAIVSLYNEPAYLVCAEDWDTDILQIDGNYYDICSKYGKPAHIHNWDNEEVLLEPTTESEGEARYTCSICEDTKTVTLPKTDDILVDPDPTPTPGPEPEPDPEPTSEPSPYDDTELRNRVEEIESRIQTLSENQINDEVCLRLQELSLSVNKIENRMVDTNNHLAEIEYYTKSVSGNTAELVRLSKNDINNEDMLNQLSGNIESLNTRLTELSVYLGYFFAFMIFIIIVIIFKGTWKLIEKYLLNTTIR